MDELYYKRTSYGVLCQKRQGRKNKELVREQSVVISILLSLFLFIGCNKKQDFVPQSVSFQSIDHLNDCSIDIENTEDEDIYLVINSQEDLEKYVIKGSVQAAQFCHDLQRDFSIDFSNKTLLIGKARLTAIEGQLIEQTVEKSGPEEYQYNVRIMNGGYTAIGQFKFGVLVHKIPKGSHIKFNVVIEEYTG